MNKITEKTAAESLKDAAYFLVTQQETVDGANVEALRRAKRDLVEKALVEPKFLGLYNAIFGSDGIPAPPGNLTINANGVWAMNGSLHVCLPCKAGDKIVILANGGQKAYYAFLASDTVISGESADYAEDESGRYELAIGAVSEELTAPEGCNWLYLHHTNQNGTAIYYPQSVKINGVERAQGPAKAHEQMSANIRQLTKDARLATEMVEWEKGALETGTGAETNSEILIRSKWYYLVDPEGESAFTGDAGTDRAVRMFFYDANMHFVSRVTVSNVGPFTIPAGACFARFSYGFTVASGTTVDGYGGVDAVAADWEISYTSPAEKQSQLVDDLTDPNDGALYRTADKDLIGEFVFRRYYDASGGVGSTVDMTGVYSNQYGSVVSDCKRGDKYVITGQGGNAPRLWCFIDGNNKIKTVAAQNASATNLEITAPDDGKLIYQVSFSYPYAITKKTVTELATDLKFAEKDETLFPFTGFDMFRTIAGLGDSYTEGDLVSSGGDWTTINGISYIGSIARRNGVTANNYGSGGATTETYLSRPAFANCLAANPSDLYLVCLGINDASQALTVGTAADINDADYTQNANTFCGYYGRIMAQLMAHAPDAKYVLIMPWPTGSDYSAYNAAVAAIAAHYSIPCINPSDDPFFTSYFWQAHKSSGHPVAMTYAGMGRAVERLFNRCVQKNPSYFKYALIG